MASKKREEEVAKQLGISRGSLSDMLKRVRLSCPACKAKLAVQEFEAGTCPACGERTRGDELQKEVDGCPS